MAIFNISYKNYSYPTKYFFPEKTSTYEVCRSYSNAFQAGLSIKANTINLLKEASLIWVHIVYNIYQRIYQMTTAV